MSKDMHRSKENCCLLMVTHIHMDSITSDQIRHVLSQQHEVSLSLHADVKQMVKILTCKY
jgi:hypothetical protein